MMDLMLLLDLLLGLLLLGRLPLLLMLWVSSPLSKGNTLRRVLTSHTLALTVRTSSTRRAWCCSHQKL